MKNIKSELRAAMTAPEALVWVNSRNDKEITLRGGNTKRPVFVFTLRVVLNTAQWHTVKGVVTRGWQVWGFVNNVTDNAYACVIRSKDHSLWGVVHPDGSIARGHGVSDIPLRHASWNTVLLEAEAPVAPAVTRIRQSVERFPAGPVTANGMWSAVETFGAGA